MDEQRINIVLGATRAQAHDINQRLGCNFFARLGLMASLAQKGHDSEIREELVKLLAFFPPPVGEDTQQASARKIMTDALRLFNDHRRFGLRRPERGLDSYKVAGDIERYLRNYPE